MSNAMIKHHAISLSKMSGLLKNAWVELSITLLEASLVIMLRKMTG